MFLFLSYLTSKALGYIYTLSSITCKLSASLSWIMQYPPDWSSCVHPCPHIV